MAHVFISYVKENQRTVMWLYRELRKRGVKAWLDREDLAPGTRWKSAIRKAIRDGNFFIACFSPEYAARERTYMNEELVVATEELRLRPTDRAWFLPVLLAPCHVPAREIGAGETLEDLQHICLYPSKSAAVDQLVNAVLPKPAQLKKLVAELKEASKGFHDRAITELGLLGSPAADALIPLLTDPNPELRLRAVLALGRIGPAAKRAVPALIQIASAKTANHDDRHEGTVKAEALRALGKIKDLRAIPALLKAAATIDRSLHGRGIEALESLGPPAVPALLEALKSGQSELIGGIAWVLGDIGDQTVVPALIKILNSRNSGASSRAARSLGKIGGSEALAALLKAANHPDWYAREHVAEALGEITAPPEAVIPTLVQLVRDEQHMKEPVADLINSHAESGLERLGDTALTWLANHRNGVNDTVFAVVFGAPYRRRDLTSELFPKEELAALLASGLRDRITWFRQRSGGTLHMLCKNHEPAALSVLPSVMPDLLRMLSGDDRDHHIAINLLQLIEGSQVRVIPKLAEILLGKKSEPSSRAARSLAIIGGTEALAALLKAVKHPDWYAREHIAEALGQFEQFPEQAIPALLQLMRDREHLVESVAHCVNDKALESLRRIAHRLTGWAKTNPDGITEVEFSLVFAPSYLGKSKGPKLRSLDRILQGLTKGISEDHEWQRQSSVDLLLTLAEGGDPGVTSLMSSMRAHVRKVCFENWKLWEHGKKLGIVKERDPWPETGWRSRTK